MTSDTHGACYGPQQLKLLGQAFDQAWTILAPSIGENILLIEALRLALANAILNQATSFGQDAGGLRDAALGDAQFHDVLHRHVPRLLGASLHEGPISARPVLY
jgi:hypothetical protein